MEKGKKEKPLEPHTPIHIYYPAVVGGHGDDAFRVDCSLACWLANLKKNNRSTSSERLKPQLDERLKRAIGKKNFWHFHPQVINPKGERWVRDSMEWGNSQYGAERINEAFDRIDGHKKTREAERFPSKPF